MTIAKTDKSKYKNVQANTPAQASVAASASDEDGLVLVDSGAIFKGEQEFVVTRTAIHLEKPGALTKERISVLEKLLHPCRLKGRSVLDVSSKPGYFLFSALQNGAESVLAVDRDSSYLATIDKAAAHLGLENVETKTTRLNVWNDAADIVLALDSAALLDNFGGETHSLEKSIAKLASLARYMVIIEADPNVSATAAGPGDNANSTDEHFPQQFESILNSHFKRIELVGAADKRSFYLAFHSEHDVDLRCPLPTFPHTGELISCRQLTEFAGLEYWSRVYSGNNLIYKQATRELIQRENALLSKLNSQYFPRVKEVQECGESSILVLKKIEGVGLSESKSEVVSSLDRFIKFAYDCLQILHELQGAGITHRDIQMGNVLVRNGAPVLIDFGWAVSKELPMFLPAGLISITPDGQACDVYSMGKLLCELAADKYPELLCIFELMTEADPAARVTNPHQLNTLLQLATSGKTPQGSDGKLLIKLIENLKINRTRLTNAHASYGLLEQKTKIEQDHRLAVLEMEYEKVVTEITRVISELHRVIGEKDELLVLLDERQKLIEGITQSQAWRLANQLQKSKKSFGSMFGKSP